MKKINIDYNLSLYSDIPVDVLEYFEKMVLRAYTVFSMYNWVEDSEKSKTVLMNNLCELYSILKSENFEFPYIEGARFLMIPYENSVGIQVFFDMGENAWEFK